MSTSTPHHPTAAELAAFRTFMTQGRTVWISFSDRATDTEARHGIGYRSLPGGFAPEYVPAAARVNARREASALRSRAWSSNEWACHPESGGAWWDETHAGLPVHSKCPTGCKLFAGHWGCHPVD